MDVIEMGIACNSRFLWLVLGRVLYGGGFSEILRYVPVS